MVTIKALDKDKKVGTRFMNLSKAFETLNHKLSVPKVNANGFSFNWIKLVQSYLPEPFQRININNKFWKWCKILLEVLPWSILGPILFNILINNIFDFINKAYICNFAVKNWLYPIDDNFKEVKSIFAQEFPTPTSVVLWETHGPQSEKIPLLNKKDVANESIEWGKKTVHAEAKQKLFSVIIDKDLNFKAIQSQL